MNRTEKTELVEQMREAFSANPHVILTSFSGLSVNQATDLRRQVRDAGGSFRVIKNRLVKIAAEGNHGEKIADRLSGPCALAFHDSDPVILAKTLSDFAKANPQVELVAGVIDGKDLVDVAGVKQLAALPGLPELRAQLLSLIQTPATTLVRLLQTPGGQVARAIDARREKLEGGA